MASIGRVGTWRGITTHADVYRSALMRVGTYVGALLVDGPGSYSVSVPSPISSSRFSTARRVSPFPLSGLTAGVVDWTAASIGSLFSLLLSSGAVFVGSSSAVTCSEAIVLARVSAGRVVSAPAGGVAVASSGAGAGSVVSKTAGAGSVGSTTAGSVPSAQRVLVMLVRQCPVFSAGLVC